MNYVIQRWPGDRDYWAVFRQDGDRLVLVDLPTRSRRKAERLARRLNKKARR